MPQLIPAIEPWLRKLSSVSVLYCLAGALVLGPLQALGMSAPQVGPDTADRQAGSSGSLIRIPAGNGPASHFGSNPATTNPATTNPATTNPATTNPATANLAISNLAISNPASPPNLPESSWRTVVPPTQFGNTSPSPHLDQTPSVLSGDHDPRQGDLPFQGVLQPRTSSRLPAGNTVDDWSVYSSNFDGLTTLEPARVFDADRGPAVDFPERSVALLQTEGGDSAFDYPLDEPTISSRLEPPSYLVEEQGIDPLDFDFNNLSRAEMLKLLMPSFQWTAEYIPEVNDYALANYAVSMQAPTYPFFGPPPPFLAAGFAYNDLTIPLGVDLPSVLYEINLGASWIRRLPNGWFIRASVNGVFASDFENTSSDAWQLRGGIFTLITLNPQWQLTAGTMVTGREDIPVIPAAGAIWTPSADRRIELMLPRPRIAQLVVDGRTRQQWVYLGAGFGGGTFAYEQAARIDDVLTYREWRAFLGWEFIPRREPGQFRVSGLQLAAEVGYVFGRSYEFESARPDIDLGDTAVFRLVFQH